MSFGGAFFILPVERGVVAKEGLWMVLVSFSFDVILDPANY
jgi:hypothetical protein